MTYEICSFDGNNPIPSQQCWAEQYVTLEQARAGALQQHDALRRQYASAALYTLITRTEDGAIIEGLIDRGILLSGELAERYAGRFAVSIEGVQRS